MPKQSKNGQDSTSTIHVAVPKSTLRKIRQFAEANERSVNWVVAKMIDTCVNCTPSQLSKALGMATEP